MIEKIKIAFQGEKGAYSQEALLNFGKENHFEFNSFGVKGFSQLFDEIVNGCNLGMVPIENSNAGSVVENYDLFTKFAEDVEIIGCYDLSVNHNLLVKSGTILSDVKKVYSHPQALSQCSDFLERNNIEPIIFSDTAGAAKFVSEFDGEGIASLSSVLCSEIYGLDILSDDVKNADDNTTKFFLVKKKGINFNFEGNLKKSNKSTLFFRLKDNPGTLYKSLGAFATYGLNLTKIESRPSKLKKFDYVFFVDVDSDLLSKEAQLCLEELNFFSKEVKILGNYYFK